MPCAVHYLVMSLVLKSQRAVGCCRVVTEDVASVAVRQTSWGNVGWKYGAWPSLTTAGVIELVRLVHACY